MILSNRVFGVSESFPIGKDIMRDLILKRSRGTGRQAISESTWYNYAKEGIACLKKALVAFGTQYIGKLEGPPSGTNETDLVRDVLEKMNNMDNAPAKMSPSDKPFDSSTYLSFKKGFAVFMMKIVPRLLDPRNNVMLKYLAIADGDAPKTIRKKGREEEKLDKKNKKAVVLGSMLPGGTVGMDMASKMATYNMMHNWIEQKDDARLNAKAARESKLHSQFDLVKLSTQLEQYEVAKTDLAKARQSDASRRQHS